MEPIEPTAALRHSRRALPNAATLPATPASAAFEPTPGPAAPPTFGHDLVELPPGSRRLAPVQKGDQGISPAERPHAERAITRLFEARGVDMVALYDQATGNYELRSRTGWVRWDRWSTPTGELRYRVVGQAGENPIPDVDPTVLRTLEQEAGAAGGVGKHVPKSRNSYPDMLGRIAQLFDSSRAPEFVYIPTPGGDPNHPGAGSHGIPDIVQSRSPLIIAGPGIARGAVSDLLVRHEDVAATVAELVGVKPVVGTNASGVKRTQLLKWQDGRSVAPAILDAKAGVRAHGAAERALMFTIDGMSQTALLDEIKKGNLPNFARIMSRGTMFRNGSLAQYPTVTWANHHALVTGAAPGHNGIVNNSWFNRDTQTEQLITDGGIKNSFRNGKLVDPKVETLYEAVERSFPGARTMSLNNPAARGADVGILELKGIPTLLGKAVSIGRNFLANKKLVDKEMLGSAKDWKARSLEDGFATAAAQAFYGAKEVPKLSVIEYTLSDNQGHSVGPHGLEARRALQQVDRQVGKILDTLEHRGVLDTTAIVLTSDHGMGHQTTVKKDLGGWFKALDRAAADGARTKESTRFVYVRSVQWQVDGGVPKAGTTGPLSISVVNDDNDTTGAKPAIPGATVTVHDAAGGSWTGVSDAKGRVQLQVSPKSGPLQVSVEHADYSVERGTIPLS